ncbi:hypothetical protein [Gynuella sp.]|uniref:hypothetical protein n=1 Tax=Gynuella sp. TaxID=2969146 RepID=UPI003D10DF50
MRLLWLFILLPLWCQAESAFELYNESTLSRNPDINGLPDSAEPPDLLLTDSLYFRYLYQRDVTANGQLQLHYQGGLNAMLWHQHGDTDFDTSLLDSKQRYRIRDLDHTPQQNLLGIDHLDYRQNLDRLQWYQRFPHADLYLGRQPITLGTARFASGTDVIYPTELAALPSDYRTGVDAIRLEIPVGELSVLDSGFVGSRNSDDNVAFGRYKTNVQAIDWTLTAIAWHDAHIYSLGTEGALSSFGLWQELAWLQPSSGRTLLRWSLGFDQSIGDFLVQLEYHYNQPGSQNAGHYLTNTSSDPFYQRGAINLYGEHYLFASLSWLNGVRSSFESSLSANLDDGSLMLTPYLTRSLSENSELTLQVNLPLGDQPLFTQRQFSMGSEFGSYPTSITLQLKGYF